MKYPIVSYRDQKVGFMPPQCEQSVTSAIRGFAYAINSREGIMNYSPNDFDLFRVGDFDTETGKITALDAPEHLMSGSSVFGVDK